VERGLKYATSPKPFEGGGNGGCGWDDQRTIICDNVQWWRLTADGSSINDALTIWQCNQRMQQETNEAAGMTEERE
jgi:hypothetical protein